LAVCGAKGNGTIFVSSMKQRTRRLTMTILTTKTTLAALATTALLSLGA
jgi:hypothetical protein